MPNLPSKTNESPQKGSEYTYDETQLQTELVPLYREMLEHFTSHMWLSESSTRAHYDALCEYVEVWNRSLEESLPVEVIEKIQHEEKKLYPLYDDLHFHFNRLTDELKK